MSKIRVLVAYDEEKIRNKLVKILEDIRYVEIIAILDNADKLYETITALKPEMIFSKYYFENIKLIDIIRKICEEQECECPIINIIDSNVKDDEILEMMTITDDKFNATINKFEIENIEKYNRVRELINQYRAYVKLFK